MVQPKQTGDGPDQGGFAGAVSAEQGHDTALGHGQADIVERQALAAVANRQALYFKYGRHHRPPLLPNRSRICRPKPATPPGAKIRKTITNMPKMSWTSCALFSTNNRRTIPVEPDA